MESSYGTDQENQYKPDVKVNNSFLPSFVIVYSVAIRIARQIEMTALLLWNISRNIMELSTST